MSIPRFAIYYNDGTVWTGGGADDELVPVLFSRRWLEAPSDGVACIVVECPDLGRAVRYHHEFYYQLPLNSHGEGDVGGSMKIGPALRQMCDLGSLVKFGGWTSSRRFRELVARAQRDAYVPPQSAAAREPQEDTAD